MDAEGHRVGEDRASEDRVDEDRASEDRAADRRFLVAVSAVLVVEVALGALADAGAYPLWLWLVLTIATVLVAAALWRAAPSGPAQRGQRRQPPVPPRPDQRR